MAYRKIKFKIYQIKFTKIMLIVIKLDCTKVGRGWVQLVGFVEFEVETRNVN